VIELTVHGDPASCRSASEDVARAGRGLSDAVSRLGTVRSSAGSAWTGGASEAFGAKIADVRSDADELESRVKAMSTALETFAGELTAVRDQIAGARERAAGAGLAVSADRIESPTEPGGEATDAQATAHEAKVTAYEEALSTVEEARTKEEAAHKELGKKLEAASGDGWIENVLEKMGFAPPDGAGGVQTSLWGLGLGGTAFGVASSWMIKGRYGTFQPRNAAGRFMSPSSMSRLQRGAASVFERNWHATPNAAATRGAWQTAAKWGGRAGVAVSFGTSAFSQWSEDADDPSLSTSEKVGRAGTVGVTTAAGAWAGAAGGAQLGGAIGTAICPGAGTVVGGAIGGLVGGFAGSELGGMAGDAIKDTAGEVTETVTDFAGDAADTAGDVAGDVGDAVTFWD
jgi:uncharacterized protein YukE